MRALLLLSFLFLVIESKAQYPLSYAMNTINSEVIGKVLFGSGTIGNNSSWNSSIDIVNPSNFSLMTSPCRGYSDFTIGNNNSSDGNVSNIVHSATVTQGGIYQMSINGTSCGSFISALKAVRVYIDFNQDGLFTGLDELVYTSVPSASNTPIYNTSVQIPSTALIGTTRMRVVYARLGVLPFSQYIISSDALYLYGETHDYSIVVQSNFTISAGIDQTVCEGDSVQLQATNVATANYSWFPSTGLSSTTVYNPIATPTTTTTYTVQVDSAGYTAVDSVTVYVYPYPVFSVSADQVVCDGGIPADISASYVPGATYSWNPNLNLVSPNSAQSAFSSSLPANQDYVITVDLFGCLLTDTISIEVNPLPTVVISAFPTPVCEGGLVVLQAVSTPVCNYFQFQQYDGVAWVDLTSPGMGTTNPLLVPSLSSTTDFRVRVAENWPGCSTSNFDNITVPVTSVSAPPIIHN